MTGYMDCPTLEKMVKYTRIVCQNVEYVLLNMFAMFSSKILRTLRDIEV